MTLAAQDRFTVTATDGIAFAEFKGYDTWQVIAPSQSDDGVKAIVGSSPSTRRGNDMSQRRRFLRSAAMTIAAARLGMLGTKEVYAREPRELAAIGQATEWLNSPRLTAASLLGKVVVVDFWTYTCINWLRTLPYRRAWAQKYREALVLIGVHTPEFSFEHDLNNVRRAVRQMRVEYPVVIDNDYSIWRAFENQYWPALYFIDARGRIRQHHYGEGEYERSETAMQRLVPPADRDVARGRALSVDAAGIEAPADWGSLRTPETYLGYQRSERSASRGGTARDRPRVYAAPERLALNEWALAGEWTIGKEAVVLNRPTGRLVFRFHARDVHLVMAPPRSGNSARFRVSIDGQPPGPARGGDVDEAGNGVVVEPRLYQLVRQPAPIVDRRFEIEFLDAGVETFAFTFG